MFMNEDDLIGDYIADRDDVMEEEPDDYYHDYDDDGENDRPRHHDAVSTSFDAGMPSDIPPGEGHDDDDDDDDGVPPAVVSRLSNTPEGEYAHASSIASPDDRALYKFERYTGPSGWRKGDAEGASEKHGATIMEAKGWRRGPATKAGDATGGDDYDDDLDDVDDMDNDRARRNNAGGSNATVRNDGMRSHNATSGGGGGGSAANLVIRFRERAEMAILGRSWSPLPKVNDKRNLIRGDGLSNNGRNGMGGGGKVDMPRLGDGSVPMTLSDGTRTYVGRGNSGWGGKDGKGHERPQDGKEGEGEGGGEGEGCLLGVPMSELVRRADLLQRRAIERKVEREARYGTRNAPDVANDDDDKYKDDENDKEGGSGDNPTDDASERKTFQRKTLNLEERRTKEKSMRLQQMLWVDKHAPTSISHLLSDERTNREVLRALRGWDPYVFGKEAPSRPAMAYPPPWRTGGGGGGGGGRHPNRQRGSEGKMMDDGNDGSNNERGKYGRGGKYDPQRGRAKDVEDTIGDGSGDIHRGGRVDIRPDENSRVILLSGPPGVGKSTLAHVVCKHAGYRAIEVNASDERTGSLLTERVIRAMEGTTLDLGGGGDDNDNDVAFGPGGSKKRRPGGKPNCIILDEIDGADARASINALVDIIRAGIGSSSRRKGGRGGTTTPYLRRPIILICNHKYAPALRPILPYARQFDVQPPDPERLTSRLRAVLSAERMSVVAGGMLLRRLVAGTGGDVRSCLYALQFASSRARELAARKLEREAGGVVSRKDGLMVDISSTLIAALGDNGNGMKDMQGDVSSTVATVFRKGKAQIRDIGHSNKRQKTSNDSSRKEASSSPKGVDVVLKTVDHFGDNSKTLDCLWMNVNRVSYVDPSFDRCCGALEWLSGADTYRSHRSNVAMNNGAEHQSMQKYHIPTAAAAVHLLCCVETRPDLTFSTRPLSDCHYQNQANVSLVHRFVEGLPPRARRGIGGGTASVVSDVIPYGLWLLSAGDGKHALSRPVSSVDILSAEEKLAFSAHVQTLRDLGLTYVKDGGTFEYKNPHNLRLEPEIDKLVKFEFVDDCIGRREVPSLLKELLAHGATVAALRERESAALIAAQQSSAAREKDKRKPTGNVIAPMGAEKIRAVTPMKGIDNAVINSSKNFLGFRAAKAKEAKAACRAAKVGFDRSKTMKLSNTGSGVEISKVIRFKYQKGFTQAVRAPCQIEDLL